MQCLSGGIINNVDDHWSCEVNKIKNFTGRLWKSHYEFTKVLSVQFPDKMSRKIRQVIWSTIEWCNVHLLLVHWYFIHPL